MLPHYAIAMDLGASGLRAQALDLESGAILATALTTRHPLPGANVMDHLHFALEMGIESAHDIMLAAINQVIGQLQIETDRVIRFAVCGNPIQLSLLQGIEIRDLAYAGQRKLQALGVAPPARTGDVLAARDLPGLTLAPDCDVIIPPRVRTICQVGNTSLAMARDLARDPDQLEMMRALAGTLQATHCLFASSKTFQNVYILELSYWTEGMPMTHYRRFLKKYGLPDLLPVNGVPKVVRTVQRDIDDVGRFGLTTLTAIGGASQVNIEACCACLKCVEACPSAALTVIDETPPVTFALAQARCRGVACRRCERACPEKVFESNRFFH